MEAITSDFRASAVALYLRGEILNLWQGRLLIFLTAVGAVTVISRFFEWLSGPSEYVEVTHSKYVWGSSDDEGGETDDMSIGYDSIGQSTIDNAQWDSSISYDSIGYADTPIIDPYLSINDHHIDNLNVLENIKF